MIYDISHKTTYAYASEVMHSQHLAHLSPRALSCQTIYSHTLEVTPQPTERFESTDAFGNPYAILDITEPHSELILHAHSRIERNQPSDLLFGATTAWDRLEQALSSHAFSWDLDTLQYRCMSGLTTPTTEIADYAMRSFPPGRAVFEAVCELTERVYEDFKFDPTATDISTPISEVFATKRGVCQDFAHLALACLRGLRIPCRYVSGYILTRPPPGQVKLQGADASHAWISVWATAVSWRDFDPTNGIVVQDEHVAIAHGRDYNDVSPISGVLVGGGAHEVHVGVDMLPVGENVVGGEALR